MIKKLVIVGGGVLLVGLFVFGRSAISYVRTSAGYVTDAVQDSVPVQFQIDRARGMLKDLVPEVRRNMHVIAKEEVEVQRLQEQIEGAQKRLGKDKGELIRLRTDLAGNKDVFKYAGRSYTSEQVKADLASRFKRFKTSDATLGSMQQMCASRQKSLNAARTKLEGMLAARRQLTVEVENLEARLQMVEAAETTSNYQFDDSQLGRVKELVDNLRTRLEVSERMVNSEGYFHDEIPLDEISPDDIVDQVTKYFGEDTPEVESIAKD
jgi:chromosome segregation ATPase